MHIPFSRSLLACSVFAVSSVALANETIDFGNVVVSASGFEQKITDAPASISVISREELEKKRVTSIADALSDVEGVDVGGSAGKTGGLNISMRGMESKYTLILIDGRRQNAAGNVTPNGFGETSTSFMPPVSAIERIEVIRGPMATLYGSDAMGGVINIITRKVNTEWGGSITAETTLQEKSQYGDSRATNAYLSGPIIEDKLGLTLRGSYFERDKSKIKYDNASGESVNPSMGRNPVKSDIYNLGTRLVFTPNEDNDLGFEYEVNKQTYDNKKGQLGTLGAAGGYEDEQRYDREQYTLFHTGRYALGTLESSIMRNTTETHGRLNPSAMTTPGITPGGKRKLESENTIFDTKFMFSLGDHFMSVGGQLYKAELTDGVVLDKFKHRMNALFIEDEWRFHDDFSLTLGLRRDHHDKFGTEYSPRAYLVWNANDNWTVKGGVSKGFKAPELQQLADGINGFGRQGKLPLIGNPDLKPETTVSTELGFYFDNLDNFNGNFTLFHNKFKDKLATTTVDNCRVTNSASCVDIGDWYEYDKKGNITGPITNYSKAINVDEAITQGYEVAGTYHFTDDWSLNANYTYTRTEQKSGANKGWPLTNTPRHMFNAGLNWQTTDRLNTWLKTEYRSERYRRTENTANFAYNAFGDYKAYTLFHLGGSYQATDNLVLNATIYNLLDKDFIKYKSYTDSSGKVAYDNKYNNNQERRRLWLSATYNF
ncbi:TonB-dependent receptor domain-containing protein [Thiopseudomonas alkaliphila]|uniref:TonB-dependent receptor domain-containing protein n=1 Tax=Thiopseudomonas alkaliphila TaxID=1697053 RepID=UPI000A66AE6E|nr:TonB-dependent receptor [Thiopseudomonas alkaliphila]MDM1716913.1 TonB-dependent receptor [Thiopseudomonas alkaliphila]